jgi:hypothetical protein
MKKVLRRSKGDPLGIMAPDQEAVILELECGHTCAVVVPLGYGKEIIEYRCPACAMER